MSALEYISKSEAVSMHDDWFEIADENHFWMKWRWKTIAKCTSYLPKPSQVFLEIGSGNGISVNQFEQNTQCIVDGCDLNEKALLLSKPSKGRKFVYNIFDKNPNLLHYYDGIILLDVLEHIDDDTQFLKTALEHSKSGGKIIINVPAHQWLYSDYDKAVGHVRRYSPKSLKELLERAQLTEIKIYSWGAFLLPIAWIRKIMISGKKEDIIKAGFKPSSKFINFFLTVLMKIETSLPFRLPFGTSVVAVAIVK